MKITGQFFCPSGFWSFSFRSDRRRTDQRACGPTRYLFRFYLFVKNKNKSLFFHMFNPSFVPNGFLFVSRPVCDDHRGGDPAGHAGLQEGPERLWKSPEVEVQDQRCCLMTSSLPVPTGAVLQGCSVEEFPQPKLCFWFLTLSLYTLKVCDFFWTFLLLLLFKASVVYLEQLDLKIIRFKSLKE